MIEDDFNAAKLIRGILAGVKGFAFEVEHVGQLGQGLRRLTQGNIDVVILDLSLPDSSGFDTFIKAHNQIPEVPIVILTGTDDEAIAIKAVQQGAQDYLFKDELDITFLGRAVCYAIERSNIEKALRRARDDLELRVRERTKELLQSLQKLQRILEETAGALASALEARDPYTAGHQKRVTQLACVIAKELRLPEEQIKGLYIASIIHDIGKISIPTEILVKPTKLTELEFAMIKNHPQMGYEILKAIEFSWPVAQIVLQHHERMNGSGYPQGLSGEGIFFEAKILAVADVVEAMAFYRPYRPALGIDRAMEEISKNKNILYSPEIVDICYKLFTEKRFNI